MKKLLLIAFSLLTIAGFSQSLRASLELRELYVKTLYFKGAAHLFTLTLPEGFNKSQTYQLPTDMPDGDGYVLSSTELGVWSWIPMQSGNDTARVMRYGGDGMYGDYSVHGNFMVSETGSQLGINNPAGFYWSLKLDDAFAKDQTYNLPMRYPFNDGDVLTCSDTNGVYYLNWTTPATTDFELYDVVSVPWDIGTRGESDCPYFYPDSTYWEFAADTLNCRMFMNITLPNSWKEATTIYPVVHYKHETGIGTPTFVVKYKWVNLGQDVTIMKWTKLDLTQTTSTTNKTLALSYSNEGIGNLNDTDRKIFSKLLVQLWCNTAGVKAYGFDLIITKNSHGSESQTEK
jgi:hypothetical protein